MQPGTREPDPQLTYPSKQVQVEVVQRFCSQGDLRGASGQHVQYQGFEGLWSIGPIAIVHCDPDLVVLFRGNLELNVPSRLTLKLTESFRCSPRVQ